VSGGREKRGTGRGKVLREGTAKEEEMKRGEGKERGGEGEGEGFF